MSKRIYVGNLPFNATEDEVRALFAAYGEVESVHLVTDRETGRPRGFGFVEMPASAADAALEALKEASSVAALCRSTKRARAKAAAFPSSVRAARADSGGTEDGRGRVAFGAPAFLVAIVAGREDFLRAAAQPDERPCLALLRIGVDVGRADPCRSSRTSCAGSCCPPLPSPFAYSKPMRFLSSLLIFSLMREPLPMCRTE
jgi:hypothetical protein